MRYVIIGNSAAGIGAVEGIRRVDRESKIIIVTNEPYHTYSRPLISYFLLDKVDFKKMKYRDDEFYNKNNVELISNMNVTSINAKNKNIVLSDGAIVEYDKLLNATGSKAFIPDFEGLDKVEKKYTFMSFDDAKCLEKSLNKDAKVLIVGAGLIGLKCAEGILNRVKSVTVVDLAPRILSSILDNESSKLVQNHLEEKGINFKLSGSIKSFSTKIAVLNNNAGEIEFDVLVLAVGVHPNTSLLKGIAEIEKGIIINSKGETTYPDIYAAGDCTQSFDISSGQNKVMALLPNAYIQGECAGINMAGGNKEFNKAIPMNAIGFFGLHIITAGNYNGDVYYETKGSNYKKLFYGDNRLKGYILIGNKYVNSTAYEKAGIYTSLIRDKTPLDSIDFELICKKPGLMAFTEKERNVKLGGA